MAKKTKRTRRGNKQNSALNREWGAVKAYGKRLTASRRRNASKDEIKDRLNGNE